MAKRVKSPAWKFRMAVATLLCFGLLGGLSYHLWNFQYTLPVQREDTPPLYRMSPLQPVLQVGDGTEFQSGPGICVSVSLLNAGQTRIRLVDTQILMPLYDVKLLYHGADGAVAPAAMTAQQIAVSRSVALTSKGFDRETDSLVELGPGRALTRVIPLWQLFDVRQPGTYDLTVTYQPRALAQGPGGGLGELGVLEQGLSMSATFSVPLKKEPVPAQQKTGETRESAPAEAPKKGL